MFTALMIILFLICLLGTIEGLKTANTAGAGILGCFTVMLGIFSFHLLTI